MPTDYCPLCYARLEVREVAPCMECGHKPEEIEQTLAGRHTFIERRIFGNLTLVLCDFCEVDFGSFAPEFFGLPRRTRLGLGQMDFVRMLDHVVIGQDKFCPQYGYRLAFLEFAAQARQMHQPSTSGA